MMYRAASPVSPEGGVQRAAPYAGGVGVSPTSVRAGGWEELRYSERSHAGVSCEMRGTRFSIAMKVATYKRLA